MTYSSTSAEVTGWRPQRFGRRNVRKVDDPIIEPLWQGSRILLIVAGPGLAPEFIDEEGEPLEGPPLDAIAVELGDALRADSVVLDGYLTHQATAASSSSATLGLTMPSGPQVVGQMLFGRRGANAAARAMARPTETDHTSPLAFVAIDLVEIDGDSLLDVPLLERKRLLDSALDETHLVRRGAYVRPPVDSWLVAWRSVGFGELAYKAANSRYLPGRPNDDWATVTIPRD